MMQSVWMFPGQGAQSARMGFKFLGQAPFAAMIERIEVATGRQVRQLVESCVEGDLVRTDRAQLAIFAMSMGLLAGLKAAGHHPALVAGHSLGHFSALVAAGVIGVEEAAVLVDSRGRFMRAGGERIAGGMGVVQGLPCETVETVLAGAGLQVWAANVNLADQTVVSGAVADLPSARDLLVQAGGRWVGLNVSGAFHTPLLAREADAFAAKINRTELADPRVPVLSNATGRPLTNAAEIRADLIGHMTGQVRWVSVMDQMLAQAPEAMIEVGPGKVLTGLMMRHCQGQRPYPTSLPPLFDRALGVLAGTSPLQTQDQAA